MQLCVENGAKYVFDYTTNKNIQTEILQLTNQKGVNLVLDCVGAQNYELTHQSLGIDARWVLYGTMGGSVIDKFNLTDLMKKRASLITSTLKPRNDEYKSYLISQLKQNVLKLFEDGTLKPNIF